MNDINDPNFSGPEASAPDSSRPVAFCQNCGKPLSRETVRIVGPAVYCEPCLAARLAGVPAGAGARSGASPTSGPAGAMPGSATSASATGTYAPVSMGAGGPRQAFSSGEPNPGLAALLGLIPGVGAMYNEQYAKGIVHLIVFATLVSLANAVDIFGLFVAGWIFYMAIEAHHTARARRDGTPLPNPFGLNDIGERLGFGRTWSGGPGGSRSGNTWAGGSDAAGVPYSAAQAAPNAYAVPPASPPPTATAWGAPNDTQSYAYAPPPFTSVYQAVPPSSGSAGEAWRSRFPAGAVVLIALGSIFLLSTTGIFHGFPAAVVVGFALVGLAVWIFVRRMSEGGASLQSAGTPAYRFQVLRALRASVWLMLLGVLFLLNTFHILTWHRSWPLFIILAGVMALLERSTYQFTPMAGTQPITPPVPPHARADTSFSNVAADPFARGNDASSHEPHQGGN